MDNAVKIIVGSTVVMQAAIVVAYVVWLKKNS